MSCIPPETRRLRMIVSPRKRSSVPPWRRASMQTSRFVILSRESPDSVTSGPGPLMPERRISPPLPVTIPRQKHQNKRETASGGRKRRSGTHFSRAVHVCCTRLASVRHGKTPGGRRKTTTARQSAFIRIAGIRIRKRPRPG